MPKNFELKIEELGAEKDKKEKQPEFQKIDSILIEELKKRRF